MLNSSDIEALLAAASQPLVSTWNQKIKNSDLQQYSKPWVGPEVVNPEPDLVHPGPLLVQP